MRNTQGLDALQLVFRARVSAYSGANRSKEKHHGHRSAHLQQLAEQRKELLRVANACPIHKALAGSFEMHTQLVD